MWLPQNQILRFGMPRQVDMCVSVHGETNQPVAVVDPRLRRTPVICIEFRVVRTRRVNDHRDEPAVDVDLEDILAVVGRQARLEVLGGERIKHNSWHGAHANRNSRQNSYGARHSGGFASPGRSLAQR